MMTFSIMTLSIRTLNTMTDKYTGTQCNENLKNDAEHRGYKITILNIYAVLP